MAAAGRSDAAPSRSQGHQQQQEEDNFINSDSAFEDDEFSAGSTAEILSSPPPPYFRVQDPPNIRCKRCRSLGATREQPAFWKLAGVAAMTVGTIALCFLFVAWYRADAAASGDAEARRGGPEGRSGREGRGPAGWSHSWRSRGAASPGSDCAGCVEGSRCRRLEDGTLACTESCLAEEWPCRSGLCVSKHSRCDGLADCDDLSDETGCPCDEDVNFRCGLNTSCLPLDRRCDGRADCWDIADEVNCPVEECPPGDAKPYHCHSWHLHLLGAGVRRPGRLRRR
ncbi:hypothetical protein HPB50_000498 [Hyalomma asiaticum]|uniref:Uncharacterized protein n=1 Tax=Hyalomma asiaticum TaxID=266040 RepID=A0ACB7RL35_HYAAI|nr:hypothetical protein HPB50_000498 [Hyalomma asiaticum]